MAKKTDARRVVSVPVQSGTVPITVVEMASFERSAAKLFNDADLEEVIFHVSQFRELGTIIPRTGDLRKLRWASDASKGKSGGARIVYYYSEDDMPLYLIAVYRKSDKLDLSEPEKKAAKKMTTELKRVQSTLRRRSQLKVINGRKSD